MKKLMMSVLAIGLVTIPFVNNGQEEEGGFSGSALGVGGSSNGCATSCISTLEGCLNDNGVNYRLVVTGSTADLYTIGSCPPGHVNSCVAHYNTAASSCSSAPVIVKRGSRR